MKIEANKPAFKPLVITLETPSEVMAMNAAFGMLSPYELKQEILASVKEDHHTEVEQLFSGWSFGEWIYTTTKNHLEAAGYQLAKTDI